MTSLTFSVLDARAEPYAAVPTMLLRMRICETDGVQVQAIALRCQIRIEPQRRRYTRKEERQLYELFGPTPGWGDSLRPFLWTHVATTVSGFKDHIELDLPVPCSYDFDVAGAKYLHSLGEGEVPLLLLFSGIVFTRGTTGFAAEPVSWDGEASYRLPVAIWRGMMDLYYPNGGWLRLSRETIDALQRFKADRALPTWDLAFERLLKEAGEEGE